MLCARQIFPVSLHLKMSKLQRPGTKNRFSKGLFAVILLLGFFAFSGYAAQTTVVNASTQTTLVVNAQSRFEKSITYQRALAKTSYNHLHTPSYIDVSRMHSARVTVCINGLGFCDIRRSKINFFFRLKTIPQNSGDEPASRLG